MKKRKKDYFHKCQNRGRHLYENVLIGWYKNMMNIIVHSPYKLPSHTVIDSIVPVRCGWFCIFDRSSLASENIFYKVFQQQSLHSSPTLSSRWSYAFQDQKISWRGPYFITFSCSEILVGLWVFTLTSHSFSLLAYIILNSFFSCAFGSLSLTYRWPCHSPWFLIFLFDL